MTREEFIALLRRANPEVWEPDFYWATYGASVEIREEHAGHSDFFVGAIEVQVRDSGEPGGLIITLGGAYEDIVSLMLEVDPHLLHRMRDDAAAWSKDEYNFSRQVIEALDPLRILMWTTS